MKASNQHKRWRARLHDIIYEVDTPLGKLFDVLLLFLIILSIILVMLESVEEINIHYHQALVIGEWIITILFSIEYIARVITVKKPLRYIFSFYGIIDLLSTIPMYLSYFITGSSVLIAVRSLRLLRIFRILKLIRFIREANQLKQALKASRAKIMVFMYTILILSVLLGTVMYLVESNETGFTSIPRSIYWTIVTLTTVGYGDIAPQTPLGQFIATMIMILGYGIIAVPTGIVTVAFARQRHETATSNTTSCPHCMNEDHKDNAKYCHKCGNLLHE
ncbi:MAG: ion transporter [Sinomicrobium sp.]|nr:ion transporter [Sinomicrobium sp.]